MASRRVERNVRIAAMAIAGLHALNVFSAFQTSAAEIRLNTQCRPEAAVVTLGDVATIHALDPETTNKLAGLELFPAPAAGRQRFLTVQQLQEMLFRRGVNLSQHTLSGSARVAVSGVTAESKTEEATAFTQESIKRAEARLTRAVVRYLCDNTSSTKPWIVDVTLDQRQVGTIAGARSSLSVRGGEAPWLGLQRFEITADSKKESTPLQIDAHVSLPPDIVVAVRALPRGAVISAADVRLQPVANADTSADRFYRIDAVIGMEVATAVGAGRPVTTKTVRRPLLIRRGEVVTVFARAAGISVRVVARARDDGSLDDAVAVESMLDKTVYYARVSGLRQAEVFAQPVRVKPTTAPPGPTVESAARVYGREGGTL